MHFSSFHVEDGKPDRIAVFIDTFKDPVPHVVEKSLLMVESNLGKIHLFVKPNGELTHSILLLNGKPLQYSLRLGCVVR